MGQKERLIAFCESMGMKKAEFERLANLSNGYVNKLKGSIGDGKLNDILRAFPQINRIWLLTGEGDMLNPAYYNNKMTVNGNENVSNIGGQHTNVSMPESGTQKIIKPDGSVEIQSLSSSVGTGLNDTDRLNQRIQDLERIILEKDATIKSKDETIWALRTMLDRQ